MLDLYAQPSDPQRPVICLDEYPYALQSTPHGQLPLAPHRGRREDYAYARHGGCSLFAVFEPATGWREIVALPRRTRLEFAQVVRRLVETHCPAAATIRLVCDNLNTHTGAALYDAFPAADARRVVERLEFHYTPKHGSWLNLVEVEWAILDRQCLARRLPDLATVQREVDAWVAARNAAHATVHWRFTIPDARRWLARCYPEHPTADPA